MPITNQDKPTPNLPQTELNVGSGFNLLVGGIYKLIIGAVGAPGITNIYKNFKTRWDTWSLSWENNTVHSWDDLEGNIQTNVSKVSVGETWATNPFTYAEETRTWLQVSQLFTNTDKPTP